MSRYGRSQEQLARDFVIAAAHPDYRDMPFLDALRDLWRQRQADCEHETGGEWRETPSMGSSLSNHDAQGFASRRRGTRGRSGGSA